MLLMLTMYDLWHALVAATNPPMKKILAYFVPSFVLLPCIVSMYDPTLFLNGWRIIQWSLHLQNFSNHSQPFHGMYTCVLLLLWVALWPLVVIHIQRDLVKGLNAIWANKLWWRVILVCIFSLLALVIAIEGWGFATLCVFQHLDGPIED
jgi:hypothetical protein